MIYARYRPRTAPSRHREPITAQAPAHHDQPSPTAIPTVLGQPVAADRLAPAVSRADQAYTLLGLAQWLHAGRDPHLFWTDALVSGLRRPLQQRLQRAADATRDPMRVLEGAGFMPPPIEAIARDGETHGKLPETLRLLATALQQQRDGRRAWVTGLAVPTAASGLALLAGEVPLALVGMTSIATWAPGAALMALGTGIAAAASANTVGPGHVVPRILSYVPGFGWAYKWRSQANLLEAFREGAALELPPTVIARAAAVGADHFGAKPDATSSRQGVALYASWFSARERAAILHADGLDRLDETLRPLIATKRARASIAHRATIWGVIGLALFASTLIGVLRVAALWMQYIGELGINLP